MSVRNPHEIHAAFEKAFNSGDLDGVVALYEKDAVLVTGSSRTITGQDAIREAYCGYLAMPTKLTLETVAAFESDGLAREPTVKELGRRPTGDSRVKRFVRSPSKARGADS